MNQHVYERVLEIRRECQNTISYLTKLESESKEAFFPGIKHSVVKMSVIAGAVKLGIEKWSKELEATIKENAVAQGENNG